MKRFGNRPSVFAQIWRSTTLASFVFLALLIPPWPTFARGAEIAQPAAAAAPTEAYDAASFAAELRRLGAAIEKSSGDAKEIDAIQKVLPPSWKIDTSEAHYEFSSEPLRELLECNKCDAAARKSRFAQAKSWTDAIALQLEGYAAHDGFSAPDARATLDQILKRREFGAVRPPSQWDLLRERINAWLMRILGRLFENIGRHPLGAKLLFWLILFSVVGWLAMMLVRFWLGRARLDELRSVGEVAFARSWQEWIRAAREAAARGDFREAVHSVYWAGIAHLEDDGTISRDRTRTPREHLQLVAEAVATAAAPQISRQRDSLAALTALFERVWYGRSHADARDFDASMKQAEGLGMRSAIDPSDRKLLLIAGAVMLVLAAALAIVSPPPAEQGGGTPSIYSDASGGARAAFLLLWKLHRNLHVWERPPTDLPQDSADAILILANPEETPSRAEKEALLQFAEMGGRIIFTGPRVGDFFPNAGSSDVPLAKPWETYQANLPSSYTRHAAKISLQKQSEWEGNNPAAFALYGEADSPAVMMWSVGDGVILWWAGPTPLTNAGITQEGNLNFLLDAVSDPLARANQQPEIYWDEYFHGQRATLWAYFQKTPVPWGLLQFGVLGLAVLFTFSRRSGPIVMPAVATRLAPLEFVDTLGGLYQRAHAEPAVVEAVYQRVRGSMTRHLRLPMTIPNTSLDEAVRGRLGLKDDSFLQTLQRADAAGRARKISPAEALELVRKLENYEVQLGLKKKKQEKH